MMKIQVTDTFTEPTKADYAQLEKNGGRNAFADEVRRTVKDNGNINGCEINECKNNKNNEVTQIFIISEVSKLIQNVERKGKCISTEEALNRINPNFVKVFLDGKTPFNLDNYNANSKGKKKKGVIRTFFSITITTTKKCSIYSFFSNLSSKSSNLSFKCWFSFFN